MNYIYTQTPYIYENSRDIYDNLRSATAKCFVNHQYSVPTIFQRVNRISILNKGCTYMMPCSMFIPHTDPS